MNKACTSSAMRLATSSFAIDVGRASAVLQVSECPTPPMAAGRVMDLACVLSGRAMDSGCEHAKRTHSSNGSSTAPQSRSGKRPRRFFEDPAQRYAATIEFFSASGRWSDLLEMANSEIAASQSDACTYCLRAAALLHTGSPREAIVDCNRALQLDNSFVLAYSIRAHCFYEIGDVNGASADFKRLMDAQPAVECSRQHPLSQPVPMSPEQEQP